MRQDYQMRGRGMKTEKIDRPEQLSFSESMIYHGDALTVLRRLPDCSVQTVVTSPPYWGLRDYAIPDQLGLEGRLPQYLNALRSIFSEVRRVLKDDGIFWLNIGDGYTSGNRGWRAPDKKNPARAMSVRPETPRG
ncbi:DNA methyltransferase [Seohaeicola zhoushanensis]